MKYSLREERANTLTHALGVFIFPVAGTFLILNTFATANNWAKVSSIVYILMVTLSYLTSTLYHYEKSEVRKALLRKFDHAAIYLCIAGTYTPFTLVVLREKGYWGWILFAIIWIAAVVGVLLSFMKLKNASRLETICYVAMGWVVVIAFKPLMEVLSLTNSMNVFYYLLAGGLFYTVGAVIYSLKKIEFMHAIWHLFVLGGGICHLLSVWQIKL